MEHEEITVKLLLKNTFSWFLVVLFYVTILFWILERIRLIERKIFLISALTALAVLSQILGLKTVMHVEIIPVAMLYFVCGHYYMKWSSGNERIDMVETIRHFWIVAIPITAICSFWNSPVTMYDNSYGNLLLFGITSICGIWATLEIGSALQSNSILQWLGKNSVIIYVFHGRLLNVLHGLGKMLFPALTNSNYSYPAYWHYFLITMVALVPIVCICNRYFWFLFGKNKQNNN